MSALIQLLGWALLHALWQGCLLALLAAFCGLFLVGSHRYRLHGLVLGLCLILPAATAWHFHRPAPAGMGATLREEAAIDLPQPRPELTGAVARPLLERLEASLQPHLPRLVALWAVGASLMALRLGGGLALSLRWKRQGNPAPGDWQATMDRLARRMGLRRKVPLLLARKGNTPFSLGLWKPVVLFPAVLFTTLPPDHLEALLAHELAHVHRLDYLSNLLQGVVETLLFFHPAVWWLSARIRVEREELADDLAARSLGNPRCLALALNALDDLQTDLSRPLFPALAARGGHLLHRIERLLSPKPWAGSSWGWLSFLVIPGLVLALRASIPEQPPIAAPADLVAQIDALAAQEGLDPQLLRSMAWVESGFNAKARSSQGAMGVLQVMPQTAQAHGAKDLNDPAQVMAAGAKYLRFLLDRYQGDLQKAVAAYNCGEQALEEGRISEEATRYRALVLDVFKAKAVQPEAPLGEGEVQGYLRRVGGDLQVQLRIRHRGSLIVDLLSENHSLGAVRIGTTDPEGASSASAWVESRPNIRIQAPKPEGLLKIRVEDGGGRRGEVVLRADGPWNTFDFQTKWTKP
ncbi:transglycosylase SLT domain-containing protein [Geothrix sp. PMB-07]|uniref:M56 family metallopeptidase n=1 Tax=Geothrix sp. PMB-07 TaxID=3068640 RepID=UPI0027418D4C|nr:transglycosylase SLT domain-containing protein [Geothrix sp. PMB-07]WLT32859.1 transglycosylase SLT domain-containing protein [Geothrix sp. PMB-07]